MNVKKLLWIILAVFVIFWLFQDPRGLADSASAVASWLVDAFETTFRAMLEFIRGL